MRICLYVGTALPRIGGAEMVVDRLAREWTSAGHRVTVLAPRPGMWDKPDDSVYPYEVARHLPFFSSRYGVEWYGRYLTDLHRMRRFELVHCHGFYPHGFLAARAKGRLGVPIVATSHGGDVAPDDLRYSKPRVRARILWGMRRLDAMIAISQFTRDGFRRLCPDGVPVVDIPNGVELAKFRLKVARPADWPAKLVPGEYFAFMGRFKARKGIDVLLRAFASIADRTTYCLALAGDGEERPALERLAAELGIADRIVFTGMVAGASKLFLMQNAGVGVVPSRVWEAFGLVAVEFMAAGRPVIVSDLPGMADLVRPGETGFLVPPDHAEKLAERLLTLASERERREAMAVHAARGAAAYDWHLVARKHIELFERLVSQSKQRQSPLGHVS